MDDNQTATEGDLGYWLALQRTPGFGETRIDRLLQEFGDARVIFENAISICAKLNLQGATRAWLLSPRWESIEKSLRWREQPNCHIITRADPRYPPLLDQISSPPTLLFVQGDPTLLCKEQLAMVGSRNPSQTGRHIARDFAANLSGLGITITSGMAIGIDGAAHIGALEAGGSTIAVTATGLDRVYPPEHRKLARQIAEHGTMVSEFSPGTPPARHHFPRRNRIISGLSIGTLVVEAARSSGALITAREAADAGREVFAIPGSIHNPLSRGCHQLIRDGAKLVEELNDIVEEIASLPLQPSKQPAEAELDSTNIDRWDPDYQRLFSALEHDPLHIDVIISRSGLTADAVSSMLLLLELDGYVSSAPGGRYSLNRPTGRSKSNRQPGEAIRLPNC